MGEEGSPRTADPRTDVPSAVLCAHQVMSVSGGRAQTKCLLVSFVFLMIHLRTRCKITIPSTPKRPLISD
ncbi:hypothetical protein RRG08_054849 [Elysia crispata]|uniref:Uncharacterized protein n=1 Tax=Elysia crispata TaxID=231223 RepID=A0AAE1A5M6_9GAST|nr:hypothetical protein RRG08_054849 [Elysia crispata]